MSQRNDTIGDLVKSLREKNQFPADVKITTLLGDFSIESKSFDLIILYLKLIFSLKNILEN